jgi:tetratricopeptide (TPR) repeat protein
MLNKKTILVFTCLFLFSFFTEKSLHAKKQEKSYYHYALAELYVFKGNFKKAKENYIKAIKNSNNPSNILVKLSLLMLINNKYDDALKYSEQSIKADPYNIEALKFNLELTSISKNYEESLKISKKILSLDENDLDGIKYQIMLLYEKGEINEAIKVINSHEKKLDSFLLNYLGTLYQEKGNIKLAEEAFLKAFEKDSDKQYIVDNIITFYEELKIPTIEKINKLNYLQKFSNNEKISTEIIKYSSFLAEEDKANSSKHYENILDNLENLRIENDNFNLLYMKAIVYEKLKKYKKAIQILELINDEIKENENTLYYMGSLYYKIKNFKKSKSTMKKVLKVNPKNYLALNTLGYIYLEEDKNIKKALKAIKKALKIEPTDPYVKDSLAWVYFKDGKIKEAKKLIEESFYSLLESNTINEEVLSHIITINKDDSKKLNKITKDIKKQKLYNRSIEKIINNNKLNRMPASIEE